MPRPKSDKPSLSRIAKEAGVSNMTASRALSGIGYVAPATKQRILAVAERYRYRPNLLVRGIRTGRSMTVGLIVPAAGDYHTAIIQGVHDELADAGYSLILGWNKFDVGNPDAELKVIHRLIERRVDGVILRPTNDAASDMYFREVQERNIPLVAVDRRLVNASCDFVGSDDEAGARQIALHFARKGHRVVGHLAGPPELSTGRLRRDGFVAEAMRAGLQVAVETSDSFGNDLETAQRLLARTPRPTAIFAANDNAAADVYTVAQKMGLRIPDDLMVAGFGDLQLSQLLQPALTTFFQSPVLIGKLAAQALLKRIGNSDGTETQPGLLQLVPPRLIERASTGA